MRARYHAHQKRLDASSPASDDEGETTQDDAAESAAAGRLKRDYGAAGVAVVLRIMDK
jgi:hypothetical protein